MPQRLKPEVRDRILVAAASVFAANGFRSAKLSDIAEQAGLATGSLYKYFRNKDALFDAVVTPELAARLLRLLRARVRALKEVPDLSWSDMGETDQARDLLAFWIEHRHVVLILLRGADGTRYAHVRGLMIRQMQRTSLRYIRQNTTGKALPPSMSFVLSKLFDRTLEMIADILAEYEDPGDIQTAIAHFWRYQLAGLAALLGSQEPAL